MEVVAMALIRVLIGHTGNCRAPRPHGGIRPEHPD